ncbi:HNH endonuclease signature motif containing protein [Demetria terragena]|uniref:HNH endonuclease signature motif containing protein n=1 Tax=Demetria terragena TaxID=63959 RepID=UPI001FE07D01|nr:HNH endonuclease signature motif containing protein [Demetria terragena]
MSVDVPLLADVTPLTVGGVPADAGMSVHECAGRVHAVLEALTGITAVRYQASSGQLAVLTQEVLAVLQLAESAAVGLVAEAIQRGVIDDSTAAGATQWVSRLASGEPIGRLLPDAVHPARREPARVDWPGVEPVVAARIAKVAAACTQPQNEVLVTALRTGQVGVAAASTALVEVEKIMPVLPGSTRDEVFGYFLALPAGSGSRAIRELGKRVIATFADQDYLDDADRKLDAAETVTWMDLPNGMTRLVADLGPLHAAQVEHAIDALSRPAPGNTCCEQVFHRHTGGERTGEPDDRTPGKRRADGLMLLLTRGADQIDADGAIVTSGQAKLVITIDHDVLTGTLRGFGRTEAGAALNPGQVRRLACDADILPMVLGSDSEPLDVGRRQRLVSGGLCAAVIERDRHCTYPGCARPPSWCQVHHVIPWHNGGETSLTNSALLCQTHHATVHREKHTATVGRSGVSWD